MQVNQTCFTIPTDPLGYGIVPIMLVTTPTYLLLPLDISSLSNGLRCDLSISIQSKVDLHVFDNQTCFTIATYPLGYGIVPIMLVTTPTYPLFLLDISSLTVRFWWDLSISIQSNVDLHVSDNQTCFHYPTYPLGYGIVPIMLVTTPTYPLFLLDISSLTHSSDEIFRLVYNPKWTCTFLIIKRALLSLHIL